MYTADNATTQVKSNIRLIARKCWELAPEDAKFECGLRFATFAANGEVTRRTAANEFLTGIDGLGYLPPDRSEEHTSELQSLMRISSAVFCLHKNTTHPDHHTTI